MFIQQKFILHFVSAIEKNERGNVQNLQLLEPARRDQFGDAIGTDQIFDVRIYNKDLIKLPDLMKIRLGSIVNCTLYLASKKVVINDGREFFQPYLTLKNIEVVKLAEPTQAPEPTPAPEPTTNNEQAPW
jgi:hypothetical protein